MNTSFERVEEGKEEWLTPPEIIKALGPFDLDPCAPAVRPWDTAKKHFCEAEDGLSQPWRGRVWLNPPYGTKAPLWLAKLAEHGEGTALIYARTETKMFFDYVWRKATALLFMDKRLRFYNVDGTPAVGKKGQPQTAGAPSVLVAYGHNDASWLESSGISGAYLPLKGVTITSPTQLALL
jgi:hypothetical protein